MVFVLFFGRLIRCSIRICNELSKMLQLLFRQAVDFDGFSVAPLSFASLASGLNSCRRLGGGVAFWRKPWKCHVFLRFVSTARSTLHDFQPSTRSFLPLCNLNCKKSENGKGQKCLTCIQLSQKYINKIDKYQINKHIKSNK